MDPIHRGGCLCGSVRFEAAGAPKWTGYCHCASCRRHTGAPVSAYAGFEADKVRFTAGRAALFASSPGVERGFCAACGSTLTFRGDRWPGELHVHVGALDQPEAFAPSGEAFKAEKLAWLTLG